MALTRMASGNVGAAVSPPRVDDVGAKPAASSIDRATEVARALDVVDLKRR